MKAVLWTLFLIIAVPVVFAALFIVDAVGPVGLILLIEPILFVMLLIFLIVWICKKLSGN